MLLWVANLAEDALNILSMARRQRTPRESVKRNIRHIMKQKLIRLSRRYVWALRTYLTQGKRATLMPARGLGVQAVKLGLEALDVAKIHMEAFVAVEGCSGSAGVIQRADDFFSEVVTPIKKTHHAALKAGAHLNELKETLDRRTADLAAANRSLKQKIAQRKTAEKVLKTSHEQSKKLLDESHRLQKHLRDLAHQVMATQENKRNEISHELQDEIAQTLLGINVRLLTLKNAAAVSTEGFKKEIATTQRLVEESIKSINRFARELNLRQQP
jgi:signal transduction histidine kinase